MRFGHVMLCLPSDIAQHWCPARRHCLLADPMAYVAKHNSYLQHIISTGKLNVVLVHQGLREKLTSPGAADAARLSKKLVTIHTDIVLPPVRFPMSHLELQPPTDLTRAAVKAAFASLEFAQHEKRLEVIWDNMARSQAELTGDAGAFEWHSAVKPASEFVPS